MNDEKIHQLSTIEAIFPANSLQQGFIYYYLDNPSSDTYRVQSAFHYDACLDVGCYRQAWKLAIERYPALRMCFNWEEVPVQVILRTGFLDFTEYDFSMEIEPSQKVEFIKVSERNKPFDLTKPNLFRLILIKLREKKYELLITVHHIIMDSWSAMVLLRQVNFYYKQIIRGNVPKIIIDSAYFDSQRYISLNQPLAIEYWANKIQDNFPSVFSTNFIYDLKDISDGEEQFERAISIENAEYQEMVNLCNKEKISLISLISFAWHKVLQIYTGSSQTVSGFAISGRTLPISGIEESVGLYANTLPVIINWENSLAIKEVLHLINNQILELNDYNYVYLSSLKKKTGLNLQTFLTFENMPSNSHALNLNDELKATWLGTQQKTEFNMTLNVQSFDNYLRILLQCNKKMMNEKKSLELLNSLVSIIIQSLKLTNVSHQDIQVLNKEEYIKIIHTWNATDKIYSKSKTIDGLFEDQVARTPDHIAVIYEDQTYTYRELSEVSNQLARFLLAQYPEKHVPPGALITIFMDRSVEMLISILGILKAGAAYVPIDPSHPEGRISHILGETNSYLLLTHSKYVKQFEGMYLKQKLIRIDEKLYKDLSNSKLTHSHNSDNLAYVMYTSGTTGLPKGVCITHTSVVNRIEWMQDAYSLSHTDVILQKTPYSFDVSVWELFWANWYGARLIIAKPDGHKQVDYLYELIHKHKVTIVHFVPSMLSAFIQARPENARLMLFSLRHVFCSGEELLLNQVHAFYTLCSHNVELHNLYGPTEATVDVTAFTCPRDVDVVSIGKAIHNTRLYVLNAQMQPVPAGVKGELYIGGIGLAQGYLNQPELTRTSFIPNPFATEADLAKGYTRLYKTGDMVQWLPDGNVEYLGRNDFQVKIRGQRVELTEIEQYLLKYPGIKHVIMMQTVLNNQATSLINREWLCCYYVSDMFLNEVDLSHYLSSHLPGYMLPNVFIWLTKLPLTSNGKLDKSLLPQPNFSQSDTYIAPSNDVEEKICLIYAELLNIEKESIGIRDSFFRLGGDSILAIQLVNQLKNRLDITLTVKDIFEYPDILSLTTLLEQAPSPDITYTPFSLSHLVEGKVSDD